MNNIRLFFSKSLSINFESELDKSQSHYLTKVMRLKNSDTFLLFNESGEWKAKIEKINSKNVNPSHAVATTINSLAKASKCSGLI